jgi:hypothetical protein
MRRTFGVDVLACPRCGGRLHLVALIDQAPVIQRILRHLGLPADVPEPRPARPPPSAVDPIEDQSQEAPEFDGAEGPKGPRAENVRRTSTQNDEARSRRQMPEREEFRGSLWL